MTKPYEIGSDEWNGLSKLMEEIGELQIVLGTLQQTCGKLMGSGGDINHWSGNLKEKFIEELGDVYAALDFFTEKNFSDEDITQIADQSINKYYIYNKWQQVHAQLHDA